MGVGANGRTPSPRKIRIWGRAPPHADLLLWAGTVARVGPPPTGLCRGLVFFTQLKQVFSCFGGGGGVGGVSGWVG